MEFVQPIRDKKKIDSIKKILKANSLRDYCMFVLGINSGLRISDLLNLRVENVITSKNKVKDRISIREKKTNKYKDFPIRDNARKSIEQYLQTRDYRTDEPLFVSRKKQGFLKRQRAYRIINDAAKSVGVQGKIGTHTLRKTLGYHAYQSGKDITIIQKLFNHSTPRETLDYIGITQDDVDDIYLNLNL
ncbi:site-specific integrase [Candidatus Uabimicrobium amorphum]|uniref:Integrase n=1 Tax=Uabimicrobium amorphum TaxID=2596890 RepID=A0A5S9F3P6_UABAM|nr:site-specific integrase [Candidatus Uabimicrobium amorphum]BBM84481.1 integrase [Candidatus Uabimicrobium amorphum]